MVTKNNRPIGQSAYIIGPFHCCDANETRRCSGLEHILQKFLRFMQLTFVAIIALKYRFEQHIALDLFFVRALLIGFDELLCFFQMGLLRLFEFWGGVFDIYRGFGHIRWRWFLVGSIMPWVRLYIWLYRWSIGRREGFGFLTFHLVGCHPPNNWLVICIVDYTSTYSIRCNIFNTMSDRSGVICQNVSFHHWGYVFEWFWQKLMSYTYYNSLPILLNNSMCSMTQIWCIWQMYVVFFFKGIDFKGKLMGYRKNQFEFFIRNIMYTILHPLGSQADFLSWHRFVSFTLFVQLVCSILN